MPESLKTVRIALLNQPARASAGPGVGVGEMNGAGGNERRRQRALQCGEPSAQLPRIVPQSGPDRRETMAADPQDDAQREERCANRDETGLEAAMEHRSIGIGRPVAGEGVEPAADGVERRQRRQRRGDARNDDKSHKTPEPA